MHLGIQQCAGPGGPAPRQIHLQASYAHVGDDAAAGRAVGGATDGFTGVSGQACTGSTLGIRHSF